MNGIACIYRSEYFPVFMHSLNGFTVLRLTLWRSHYRTFISPSAGLMIEGELWAQWSLFKSTLAAVDSAIMYPFPFTDCECPVFCFEVRFWDAEETSRTRPPSVILISYSAGSHSCTAKVQPDLATAECNLAGFFYYIDCLINMADHIITTLNISPFWCDHMCGSIDE